MRTRRTAPRETMLYGKQYFKGVPAKDATNLFRLYVDHVRADVRDVSLVLVQGEQYRRTTIVYYERVPENERTKPETLQPPAGGTRG